MFDVTVFHGVEVGVVEVGGVVAIVADGVFPVAALPDAAIAEVGLFRGWCALGRKRF